MPFLVIFLFFHRTCQIYMFSRGEHIRSHSLNISKQLKPSVYAGCKLFSCKTPLSLRNAVNDGITARLRLPCALALAFK